MTRRYAEGFDDGYPLRPASNLLMSLSAAVSRFLETPTSWDGNPTNEEKRDIIDAIKASVRHQPRDTQRAAIARTTTISVEDRVRVSRARHYQGPAERCRRHLRAMGSHPHERWRYGRGGFLGRREKQSHHGHRQRPTRGRNATHSSTTNWRTNIRNVGTTRWSRIENDAGGRRPRPNRSGTSRVHDRGDHLGVRSESRTELSTSGSKDC